MNSKKTIQRLKIFGSLLLALVIVSYGAPRVFLAGSTQVNQEFIAQMQVLPKVLYAYIQNPTDSGARTDQIETSQMPEVKDKEDLEYIPIIKGIYAAEDPVTKERYVKIDKGTELEKKYVTVDGRQVMIYVPVE